MFGALVLRFVFIFAGVELLESFEWMVLVFGAILLITGARLMRNQDHEVHPENNPVLRLVRKLMPSSTEYDGQKLFTHEQRNGTLKRVATPLLAVLIVVETSDVVFAVDSIPAILAVSQEQFIVFSSNAFAILGLRALYFLLADLRDRFDYLQQGLAVILTFVGVKMILTYWDFHIDTFISLGVIALILTASIVLSQVKDRKVAAVAAANGEAGGDAGGGESGVGHPNGTGTPTNGVGGVDDSDPEHDSVRRS